MEISTQEIADKLRKYALLLEGMKSQTDALYGVSHSDSAAETVSRLDDEIRRAKEIANALHEKNTTVSQTPGNPVRDAVINCQ